MGWAVTRLTVLGGPLAITPTAAADAEGLTLSSWLAEAAADRLRLKALHHLVDEWEAEHGAISVAELDALEDKVAEARRSAKQRRRRAGTKASRAVAS